MDTAAMTSLIIDQLQIYGDAILNILLAVSGVALAYLIYRVGLLHIKNIDAYSTRGKHWKINRIQANSDRYRASSNMPGKYWDSYSRD